MTDYEGGLERSGGFTRFGRWCGCLIGFTRLTGDVVRFNECTRDFTLQQKILSYYLYKELFGLLRGTCISLKKMIMVCILKLNFILEIKISIVYMKLTLFSYNLFSYHV